MPKIKLSFEPHLSQDTSTWCLNWEENRRAWIVDRIKERLCEMEGFIKWDKSLPHSWKACRNYTLRAFG